MLERRESDLLRSGDCARCRSRGVGRDQDDFRKWNFRKSN